MKSLEIRQFGMLVRVKDFGDAHRDQFPEASVGGEAFAVVAAAVAQLSALAVSKMSTARDGLRAKTRARAALVVLLEAIVRTARTIAEEVPGFDDPYRLPKRHTDRGILTAGQGFVQHAEKSRAQFVRHGLQEAFFAELTDHVRAFERALHGREAAKDAQTAAQAGITSALTAGLAAARKLDVLVGNQLGADPQAMAVWDRDRKLDPARKPRAASVAPVATPAAVVPASQPSTPPAAGSTPAQPAPAPEAGKAEKPVEEPELVGSKS